MPVRALGLPADAAPLAQRRALVARQLDLVLDSRGPVDEVRRLIADLDRISADLSRALRSPPAGGPRAAEPHAAQANDLRAPRARG